MTEQPKKEEIVAKPSHSKPRDLTPSEIEALREDARQASKRLKQLIAAAK